MELSRRGFGELMAGAGGLLSPSVDARRELTARTSVLAGVRTRCMPDRAWRTCCSRRASVAARPATVRTARRETGRRLRDVWHRVMRWQMRVPPRHGLV